MSRRTKFASAEKQCYGSRPAFHPSNRRDRRNAASTAIAGGEGRAVEIEAVMTEVAEGNEAARTAGVDTERIPGSQLAVGSK